MAYEGELVKLGNGRWARFSQVKVDGTVQESSILVAVELEGWQPGQIVNALWDRWRIAGRAIRHPAAVRFSMAAFNQESDADAVVDALRALSKEEPPLPQPDEH